MADQRSFADKVLDALESGEWMTWSQLCDATGLTLFWVRESLADLVHCGMVEEKLADSVHAYRLVDAVPPAISAAKARLYKTAYSPTWGVYVRLDSVRCDGGVFVFECSGTDRNGDRFENWSLTDRELTGFCL